MAKRQAEKSRFVSGFVSILGRANAGKSTLLNALAGTKIAIVSPKPQTTRTTVQAVVNRPGAQIVFIDTPGVHTPRNRLHSRMMNDVRGAAKGQDLLIWLADSTLPYEQTSEGIELLTGKTALLALNKIDALADKRLLLPLIERYRQAAAFEEFLPLSALTGEGLPQLEAAIVSRLPEGPQYFPPDHVTDQPERFLAAEIIREKILALTGQEIPHSIAILIDSWEDTPRLLRIAATIHTERDGQKRILIGTRGSMLKQIGTAAREELEALHQKKVFLELFVKVKLKWRESEAFLNELDWRI